MHKLREMLYNRIDEIVDSGNLDMDTMKYVGEIVDAIKDIDIISDMEAEYSSRRYDHRRRY